MPERTGHEKDADSGAVGVINAKLLRLQAALRRALHFTKGRRGRLKHKLGAPILHDPSLSQHWERLATALLRLGGASSGNSVKLFCDGDDGLESIWDAIGRARHHVWFEMYILEPDKVGMRTLEALARAGERGCEVRLLYDGIGSSRLTESILRPLRDAGVRIEIFNPVWPLLQWRWRRRGSIFRRDHRKIIIVDGKVGFCGGMNISEDYAGLRHGKARFLDCQMMLQGPCVRDVAAVFASSWRRATQERLSLPRRSDSSGATFAQVLASSGLHGRRAIQRALRLTVRHSVKHCYLTTPYFVPPARLMRAITRAAKRGVDVRILTAGVCDVPIVHLAAQHVYAHLLRHGVRIFELYDSTLHAKTAAIDGVYSTVGSFNLDIWSHKRNLEVNIAMIDPEMAHSMEAQFMANIRNAREVTLETCNRWPRWRRVLHWAACQVLHI